MKTQYSGLTADRVDEALHSLRDKPVRSATMDRLRLTLEADALVQGLPQPLQLARGLDYILDHIQTPVEPHDLILGRVVEEVPDADGEALLLHAAARPNWSRWTAMPPWLRDGGHTCFDWELLLRKGLPGLQTEAEQHLRRRQRDRPGTSEAVYLEGAAGVYQAMRRFARRYADAADRSGLRESASLCRAIADAPPDTFVEALQLIWLVGLVFCAITTPNSALTFGRMDQSLLPFYRRDLSDRRITREKAGEWILDFYCKTNLLLGRGEHQISPDSGKNTGWMRNLAYDYTPYVVIGGRRRDGSPCVNELTELFIEQVVPRFETPDLVVRYTPDMPDETWRVLCDRMRQNAAIFVYNDDSVIPALERAGVPHELAVEYTMRGCNFAALPGSNQSIEIYIPLARNVLDALCDCAATVASMEDVYAAVSARVIAEVQGAFARLAAMRREWDAVSEPRLRVEDCFSAGNIAAGRSVSVGGDAYHGGQLCISALASAADSLAAVDALVFRNGAVALPALVHTLDENFAGNSRLREMCVHAPKFGRDDDNADRHAVRLLKMVLDEFDRLRSAAAPRTPLLFPCTQTNIHAALIAMGRDLGATPDGREAGQPLADNTSPSPGSCTRGPTAMFRSLAKLPMNRLCSGALNVRLHPGHFAGENGLGNLAALILTYFKAGGLQVQLSLVDTAELRDAQEHPNVHRDLMVRITGYSAAFVDMAREAQDEIIRREEMHAGVQA